MSIFTQSISYRPFIYPWAVEAEKREVVDKYWHEGQIDLQDDLMQYLSKDGLATKNFTHEQNKKTLDTLLLFFTQLEMSVAEGYIELLPYTKNDQIKSLFIQQAAKEVRHKRAYALAGETFGFTDADWSSFLQYKEMVNKVELITSDNEDLSVPLNYAVKLAKVLLGEGIGLFAAFADLLNFKRFGLLIGFNDVNQWSLNDEEGHVSNNIKALQSIVEGLSVEDRIALRCKVHELVEEYVKTEHAVIDLVGAQEDLTIEQQKHYISFLGRLRLYQIGYIGTIDLGVNPLPWMDSILTAEKHGAFFEKKITDYTHKKLEGSVDYAKYQTILKGT